VIKYNIKIYFGVKIHNIYIKYIKIKYIIYYMEYSCNKCNKKYKHKGDYIKHINKKNSCEIMINNDLLDKNNLTCSSCKKIFSRRDVLKNHIKLNKCKSKLLKDTSDNIINLESLTSLSTNNDIKKLVDIQKNNKDIMIDLLIKSLDEKDSKINSNKLEIDNLKKIILDVNDKLNNLQSQKNEGIKENKINTNNIKSQNNKTINTNTNNIQSHNNNTITTNSNNSINNNIIIQFGSEDISKLKATEIAKIINRGFCSIEESVKQLHFNSRLPEYHNIYIADKKSKHGLVYDGEEFKLFDINVLTDDLIKNHKNNIDEYLKLNNIPYNKNMMKYLLELIKKLNDNDEEMLKRVKSELKMLLYNERNLVKNTNNQNDE
jgi:hypothetical protein